MVGFEEYFLVILIFSSAHFSSASIKIYTLEADTLFRLIPSLKNLLQAPPEPQPISFLKPSVPKTQSEEVIDEYDFDVYYKKDSECNLESLCQKFRVMRAQSSFEYLDCISKYPVSYCKDDIGYISHGSDPEGKPPVEETREIEVYRPPPELNEKKKARDAMRKFSTDYVDLTDFMRSKIREDKKYEFFKTLIPSTGSLTLQLVKKKKAITEKPVLRTGKFVDQLVSLFSSEDEKNLQKEADSWSDESKSTEKEDTEDKEIKLQSREKKKKFTTTEKPKKQKPPPKKESLNKKQKLKRFQVVDGLKKLIDTINSDESASREVGLSIEKKTTTTTEKPRKIEYMNPVYTEKIKYEPKSIDLEESGGISVPVSEEITTKKPKLSKVPKYRKPGIYMQGHKRIYKEGKDFRKRLPTFLPKRYYWKTSDIHQLGYFWFNGPQGYHPGIWRIVN